MKIKKCEEYILATEDDENYILMNNYSFYKVPLKELKELLPMEKATLVKEINDSKLYFIICLLGICISLLLYFGNNNYTLIDNKFGLSTILLLLNIPIHEFGHILALKIFYPESKFKIGFKFVFIYPAFYVDTSCSYMLPKYKRIVVYLAGNLMNCIFLIIVLLIFPRYLPYCYLIVSNILINFIPIVKSDGYYAITTLFNKFTNAKSLKSEYLEDVIRGFIMFLVLSAISYMF